MNVWLENPWLACTAAFWISAALSMPFAKFKEYNPFAYAMLATFALGVFYLILHII